MKKFRVTYQIQHRQYARIGGPFDTGMVYKTSHAIEVEAETFSKAREIVREQEPRAQNIVVEEE